MAELRWHPFIKDWVMIASQSRTGRRCRKTGVRFVRAREGSDNYDVLKYDNDFPALMQNPPEPDPVGNDFSGLKKPTGSARLFCILLNIPLHCPNFPMITWKNW